MASKDAEAKTPKLERKAVAAVVLGNALEFYDFTIYAFFAKPIGEAFFPSKNAVDSLLASLALFGIGYVMRPIGGVVIGAFADRAGRKPAMLITIALMAVGMLMLAATPGVATWGTSAQVIVIAGRLIQGLALGGEVGPSTAYLLEAAPQERRGFVASWQIASQGCAALVAGVVASALTYLVGDQAMGGLGLAHHVPARHRGGAGRSHHPEPPARNRGCRKGPLHIRVDLRGGVAPRARPRATAAADLPGRCGLHRVELRRHQHAGLCRVDAGPDRRPSRPPCRLPSASRPFSSRFSEAGWPTASGAGR